MRLAPDVNVRVATETVGGRKIARNLHRFRTPCRTPTVRLKHADAERIQREVLDARRRVLGEEHPNTLTAANNLAHSLSLQGKYVEAEQMFQATQGACRRVLGSAHPETLGSERWLERVRSSMSAESPTRFAAKASARRNERAAAPTLSPTALADAEARARLAEAELLAMLDLEEPEVPARAGGRSGSAKSKTGGKAKGKEGRR